MSCLSPRLVESLPHSWLQRSFSQDEDPGRISNDKDLTCNHSKERLQGIYQALRMPFLKCRVPSVMNSLHGDVGQIRLIEQAFGVEWQTGGTMHVSMC